MNITNYLNTNNLATKKHALPLKDDSWCDVRRITNNVELSQQYTELLQQHDFDNKWILMINPDERPLHQLSTQGKINPKKILKVNIHQRNVSLKTLNNTLEKGHCSAVILCNANVEQSQLSQLTHFAEKGKTKCIILNKQTQNVFNQSRITKH